MNPQSSCGYVPRWNTCVLNGEGFPNTLLERLVLLNIGNACLFYVGEHLSISHTIPFLHSSYTCVQLHPLLCSPVSIGREIKLWRAAVLPLLCRQSSFIGGHWHCDFTSFLCPRQVPATGTSLACRRSSPTGIRGF